MTLRSIFNGIQNFFNNFFNRILDFDLSYIFISLFVLGYLIFYPWVIYKAIIDIKKNFKKWSIIKKIVWPILLVILIFTYILPISLYLMN